MTTLIFASNFFSALEHLSPEDRGAVTTFIGEFQRNPKSPGISLERIHRTRSELWSGRITRDLRAILHKDGDTWVLLRADHHNEAYRWAERRDIGRHPVTGALQVVETVETVREVERVIEREPAAPPMFAAHEDAYLLSLGVPATWLPALRQVRDDDQLLTVCEHLPRDVVERLLGVAGGELVTPPPPVPVDTPLVAAPDARRDFIVVDDEAGLRRALDAPFDRWIHFLHPSQEAIVTGRFSGPVKVTGAAGTGKTVVAMHRARHLARAGKRVLLTSFVRTLCANLERNLRLLCTPDELARITVSTVHTRVLNILHKSDPKIRWVDEKAVQAALTTATRELSPPHDLAFLQAEWDHVIQPQGIATWDQYLEARRTGRGRTLSPRDRKAVWQVFSRARELLAAKNGADWAALCERATGLLTSGQVQSDYDAVVVDELQDLHAGDLRFLKALCREPGNLLLAGDAGQRIYGGGVSLQAIGIPVRGRSYVLKVNYRTTEQIRREADRLLGEESDDMDGSQESRRGTRSLLRGPVPTFRGFATAAAERSGALDTLRAWLGDGIPAEAIAVFARTLKQLEPLTKALHDAGLATHALADDDEATSARGIRLGSMHRAKGLEFRAVLVLGCGERYLPHPAALRDLTDPSDREQALAGERQLLYVAMTRARERLHITCAGEPSPLLDRALWSTST